MSEAILKALMQLFALISDIHDDTIISAREKNIVWIFLVKHLNNELAEKYMGMFEEYLGVFNSERIVKGSIQDRKRISLNAMRILGICEKINAELGQKQKIYVFVKLADYISSGIEVTETELDFLQTVADAFNIPAGETSDIKNFVIADDPEACNKSNLLLIEDSEETLNEGVKRIRNGNLKGRISVLTIRSTNTFLMRYKGEEVLYLNGQNIIQGETYVFDSGSSIRGAGIHAIYYSEITGHLSPVSSGTGISLDADNVSFRFRNTVNGIHNLNFTGRSGELVGVIGGSGAGKSTTLSILSGTLQPMEGTILINGYNLYDDNDREKLRGVIGFVPQDDLLIEELTVYQNLYYNARMCLGNLSEEKVIGSVNRILSDLDLDETRDLKVGNPLDKVISGGQRKRINIALELMREPVILFVDEPTSGLSSVDSELVMTLLKDLTYKGKLVIANIHQPSSEIYKMFDKIMIIDRGGYQVYCGNPNEAIIYFRTQSNHANPDEDQCTKCGNIDTEKLLQIIEAKVVDEHGKATRTRKVTPAEWAQRFISLGPVQSRRLKEKQPIPRSPYHNPGLLKQTMIFFLRDFRSKLADRQYMAISLLGPPVLAFILSYFIKSPVEDYSFYENENIPAFLFMCVITSMFFGLMGSSEEIVSDRKILKRESFLNLSWFSYLNSKVLIMFILSAIQTITFVVTGHLILGIRGMILSYWIVLFTTSCFANMLGLNLSSAFKSVIAIYILIPFIIIPQLLFSGVLVKFDRLHTKGASREYVPLIGDLMIARWSFEALAVQQFKNNKFERVFFEANSEMSKNDWYANFLTENLRKKVLFNVRYSGSAELGDLREQNIRKLAVYSAKLSQMTGIGLNESVKNALTSGIIDSSGSKAFLGMLDSMQAVFQNRMNIAMRQRDSLENNLEKAMGNAKLVKLRQDYTNKSLTDLVLNMSKPDKTGENETSIFPRLDPAYIKAEAGNGRAHFFAPSKKVGDAEFDTFTFNMMVVWIVSFILYLALYFRIPERIIQFFSNLKVRSYDIN